MEFLKALFENGESLTYEQLAAKVSAAKLNVVNIADGAYVSRSKFDDKVNSLTQQVTDLNGQISQRDKDMSELQEKLTAAQADAGCLKRSLRLPIFSRSTVRISRLGSRSSRSRLTNL